MLFGDVIQQESIVLIQEEVTPEGIREALYKSGKIQMKVTSNKPSPEAIKRTGQMLHEIISDHVDKILSKRNKDARAV